MQIAAVIVNYNSGADLREALQSFADEMTGSPWQAIVVDNASSDDSATIAGVSVPAVDGLLLEAGRLWAVQNELNQIAEIRLRRHLSSGVVEKVITSDLFQTPTTVARFGRRLAVVNAKFDTGFPPNADQYEVVVVHR